MFANFFIKSLEIQGTSHAFSFTAGGGGGYVFRPHCSLGMCNFLFYYYCVSLTLSNMAELRKALLFYSEMIRCRRVESRLSTFQQRENRAISQTTSSRLLLGSQQHYSKRVFQTLKILRIFPISRSRNGNDATGEGAFSKSIVEPTT